MPVCPDCGKFIDELIKKTGSSRKEFLSYDPENDKFLLESIEDNSYVEYFCPECGHTLFNWDRDARSFLEVSEFEEKINKTLSE